MKEGQYNNIDPLEYRKTLGKFTSGVTIVTTQYEGSVHGMTANAFLAVSLDPPLVLVSVDHGSHMHTMLPESEHYGVSILSEKQEALSQHFAGRPQEGLEIPFVWRREAPLLEGAIARLACRVVDAHPAGDHTLYIGEVEHLDYQEGAPLVFYTGRYANLKTGSLRDSEIDWWVGYNIYGQAGLGA